MRKFWKFDDKLIEDDDTEALKDEIKENLTMDELLNIIEKWTGINDLLEAMDTDWMDEDDIIESENEEWWELIDYNPRESFNPYDEWPDPHEI